MGGVVVGIYSHFRVQPPTIVGLRLRCSRVGVLTTFNICAFYPHNFVQFCDGEFLFTKENFMYNFFGTPVAFGILTKNKEKYQD